MLYLGCLVHVILQLILASIAEFFLYVIYKNLNLNRVFLQIDFKLGLNKRHQDFGPNLLLVLLSLIQSPIFKECGGKKDLVVTSGPGDSKIIFAVLYEVITIYIQLILVNVWDLGFKSALQRVFRDFLVLATTGGESCF